jgi:hypothetical protein
VVKPKPKPKKKQQQQTVVFMDEEGAEHEFDDSSMTVAVEPPSPAKPATTTATTTTKKKAAKAKATAAAKPKPARRRAPPKPFADVQEVLPPADDADDVDRELDVGAGDVMTGTTKTKAGPQKQVLVRRSLRILMKENPQVKSRFASLTQPPGMWTGTPWPPLSTSSVRLPIHTHTHSPHPPHTRTRIQFRARPASACGEEGRIKQRQPTQETRSPPRCSPYV